MTEFDSERDPIDLVADEFAQRCRRGEEPSVAEYAERYPAWAAQIRDLLPPVARMEQLRRLRQTERVATDGTKLRQVGDYRILREVGRGGMGIVYEAVQESLGRRVALKVLPKHSLLDSKNLERFRREAQAAARLHHTNIVPVFGVGEQDGIHYYVMQLIPGQGLNEILAGLRKARTVTGAGQATAQNTQAAPPADPELPRPPACLVPGSRDGDRWQQVARVGIQVAEALHYAHQQGTLHRDVKPANLLLDQHGTVWVTDFGLAKWVAPLSASFRDGNQGGALTDTGDIVGTLQYMAPESFEGRVSARSDVYSLGLTLYEFVTLEPPFRGSTPAHLLQDMSDHEPPEPRKVNPAIPRDLETIILRAIAREPDRRYPTAAELAEDLRRFLEDRPIQARRATAVELLGQWCRRNRAIARLAAALVLVFLAGFAGVIWKWQEAAAERQRAEQNLRLATEALRRESQQRAKAEAATQRAEANVSLSLQAFQDIFKHMGRREPAFYVAFEDTSSRLPPGPVQSREDAALLESILRFYDQFAEQNDTNPSLQLEAAKAYRRIRDIQQRLGHAEKAEAVDQRAIAILEKLAAEFPSEPSYRYELAKTYVMTTTRSTEPGFLEETERRLRRAVEIQEDLAAGSAVLSKYTVFLARAHGKLGSVLQQMGQTHGAETAYRKAVTYLKSLAGQFPVAPLYVFHLATARHDLADLLLAHNQLVEAHAVLEESITDLHKLMKDSSRYRFASPLLAAHYRSLATTLARLGQPMLADEASQKAKEMSQNEPRSSNRPEARHGPRPEATGNALLPENYSRLTQRKCSPGGTGDSRRARKGQTSSRGPIGPPRGLGFAEK